MPVGALAGLTIFVAFSFAIGARLVLLARREGGLPEWALAVAFIVSGGFGAALQAVRPLGLGSESVALAAFATVRVAVDIGIACQTLFTWRVFRPRSRWARAFFVGEIAAMLTVLAAYTRVGVLGDETYRGIWFWIEWQIHVLALAWSAAEPLAYYVPMRRRLRLGLADPLVTNRFLVWGVALAGALAAVAAPAVITATGARVPRAVIPGIAAGFALIAAIGYWLTFFPPRAWRRFVERRARALIL